MLTKGFTSCLRLLQDLAFFHLPAEVHASARPLQLNITLKHLLLRLRFCNAGLEDSSRQISAVRSCDHRNTGECRASITASASSGRPISSTIRTSGRHGAKHHHHALRLRTTVHHIVFGDLCQIQDTPLYASGDLGSLIHNANLQAWPCPLNQFTAHL